MKRRHTVRLLLGLLIVGTALSGCTTVTNFVREIVGRPGPGDPSISLRTTEPRWLLIKNPRFGDVPSEPEYIWVEEDKVPTTVKTLVFGKKSIIATPEIVAKYGSPPGGGRISPRQGTPYQVAAPAAAPGAAARGPAARAAASPGPAPPASPRGYVVFVDTSRIVIDLTGADGVRPGTAVSVRRDRIPIVHPVTGELLGELDEELATGTVMEVREKFSVVEIQSVSPGAEIKVKDRVVIR
jgi:hypothetical protein